MNEKLDKLLSDLSTKDDSLFFILKKIYNDPSIIIDNDLLEKEILFRKEFLNFLLYCLYDNDDCFCSRLNNNTCIAISKMINRWIEYYYVHKNKKEIMETVNINSNNLALKQRKYLDIYYSLRKYFDKNISSKLVKRFDIDLAKDILQELKYQSNLCDDNENSFRNTIYNEIRKGNLELLKGFKVFDDIFNRYDPSTIELFVCDNEFLFTIEELISNNKLNDTECINNIINVITFGIEVKCYKEIDSVSMRTFIGEQKVDKFDIKEASLIITKLYELKNNLEYEKRIKLEIVLSNKQTT